MSTKHLHNLRDSEWKMLLGLHLHTIAVLKRQCGLTVNDVGVVWLAAWYRARGKTCTPSELAKVTGLTKTTISRMIRRLTEGGCLEVHRDDDDHRQIHVVPTLQARQRLYRAVDLAKESFNQMVEDGTWLEVDDREEIAFRETLRSISLN